MPLEITPFNHQSNSFVYKKRGVASGDRNLLSLEQERALIESLTNHTPDELGLESTLWTSKVINHYIQKIYNVQYSERGTRAC
jgi:transposase